MKTSLVLRDVPVQFPFTPYPCQKDYMSSVIEAIESQTNALLESPTGTGKTLCLLCSSLAWQARDQGQSKILRRSHSLQYSDAPLTNFVEQSQQQNLKCTIIYASRTHSQLSQVARELKTTIYRPRLSLLGSREQLCVHHEVSKLKGGALNGACQALSKTRSCTHQRILEKEGGPSSTTIMDIEELASTGRKTGFCPYFYSRDSVADADLILMPYNYLLDSASRNSLNVNWKNSVVIFDEAHNLESVASQSSSFELTSLDIAGAFGELQRCISALRMRGVADTASEEKENADKIEKFQGLLLLLQDLQKTLDSVKIPLGNSGISQKGEFIYAFFARAEITVLTVSEIEAALVIAVDFYGKEMTSQGSTDSRLNSILRCLRICFRQPPSTVNQSNFEHPCMAMSQFYRVHVAPYEPPVPKGRIKGPTGRMICYWCQCPGITLEELKGLGVRSLILTSGTLSPLPALACELRLPFPVRLENPHVIGTDQAWVGICGSGSTGRQLCSSFNNRDLPEYKDELGNTLVNFCRLVPSGLLVFFPTYAVMENCISWWQKRGHWGRMQSLKELFCEPRGAAELPPLMKSYDRTLEMGGGAAFFAVCRGKLSEGMDFSNEKARCVVITGIPFAPTRDPKVETKRKYMDQAVPPEGCAKLTGEEWYFQSAARAVNQAVGRVVRHRLDYGAVILCDSRFSDEKNRKNLSKWVRPYVSNCSNFQEVQAGLSNFFRGIRQNPSLHKQTENKHQFSSYSSSSNIPVNDVMSAPIITRSTIQTSQAESGSRGTVGNEHVEDERLNSWMATLGGNERKNSNFSIEKTAETQKSSCGAILVRRTTFEEEKSGSERFSELLTKKSSLSKSSNEGKNEIASYDRDAFLKVLCVDMKTEPKSRFKRASLDEEANGNKLCGNPTPALHDQTILEISENRVKRTASELDNDSENNSTLSCFKLDSLSQSKRQKVDKKIPSTSSPRNSITVLNCGQNYVEKLSDDPKVSSKTAKECYPKVLSKNNAPGLFSKNMHLELNCPGQSAKIPEKSDTFFHESSMLLKKFLLDVKQNVSTEHMAIFKTSLKVLGSNCSVTSSNPNHGESAEMNAIDDAMKIFKFTPPELNLLKRFTEIIPSKFSKQYTKVLDQRRKGKADIVQKPKDKKDDLTLKLDIRKPILREKAKMGKRSKLMMDWISKKT